MTVVEGRDTKWLCFRRGGMVIFKLLKPDDDDEAIMEIQFTPLTSIAAAITLIEQAMPIIHETYQVESEPQILSEALDIIKKRWNELDGKETI